MLRCFYIDVFVRKIKWKENLSREYSPTQENGTGTQKLPCFDIDVFVRKMKWKENMSRRYSPTQEKGQEHKRFDVST